MTFWLEWLRMRIWDWARQGEPEDRPNPDVLELHAERLARDLRRMGVEVDLEELEREVRRRTLNAQRDVLSGRRAS
jgi:hypothetical protein